MNVRDFLLMLRDYMEECDGIEVEMIEMGGIFTSILDFKSNINSIPTVRVHYIYDSDNELIDFTFTSVDKETHEEFTFLTIQSSEVSHDTWLYAIMNPSKEPIWKLDVLELDTEMRDSHFMANLSMNNPVYNVQLTDIMTSLETWKRSKS